MCILALDIFSDSRIMVSSAIMDRGSGDPKVNSDNLWLSTSHHIYNVIGN